MEQVRFEEKVNGALRFLEKNVYETLFTLHGGEARKAEFVTPGEYHFKSDDWQMVNFPLMEKPGETVFLRGSIPFSGKEKNKKLFLRFDLRNIEGLFFLDGKPYWGIDLYHSLVPLKSLDGKSSLDFEAELYFVNWPCFDQKFPHLLSSIELVAENSGALEYYYDLKVAFDAWKEVAGKEKKLIEDTVISSIRRLDPANLSSAAEASILLKEEIFSRKATAHSKDKKDFYMAMTGHSHIDAAWLWTIAETMRKCGRTFSTALRLMEYDPEFIFSVSQPQQYQFTKDFYPDVYRQIKERVIEGRWEPVGGLWVEPDCNLISGESFVRQILYGKKFFKEEFGKEVNTAWLPDVFGFAGSMPQILKEAGIDYFYTNKLYWQSVNRFPHSLFWWEGIDGTKVLAHIPKLFWFYNGNPNPDQFKKAEAEFRQKANFPECLFPFGWGDGGGGVSLEYLAYARRIRNFPNLPRARYSRVEDYFRRAVKGAKNLPVWPGELYLETHQGCYTTQANTKKNNRTCENLLYALELLNSLNLIIGGKNEQNGLAETWKKILTFQFHDILLGSSISAVYQEIEPQYRKIINGLNDGIKKNLEELGGKISIPPGKGEAFLLFNPLNWERKEVVEIKPGVVIEVALPACGYKVCRIDEKQSVAAGNILTKDSLLENRFFSIRFNKDGRIVRLFDRVNRKEVIPTRSCANDFLVFKDGPLEEEAWNIDPDYEASASPFGQLVKREIAESGSARAILHQVFKEGKSTITQDIIIYDNIPRIDFRTEVDWQERRRMLKVAFPVTVKAREAFYEIPFGAIARPVTDSNSWEKAKKEVAALRWADLSDKKYGVALLNDCKYGYNIKGKTMRLTLLRSSTYPDPEADRGTHRFTYSLLPHRDDWRNSEVVKQGYQLNHPVLVVPIAAREIKEVGLSEADSLLKTEGLPVVVSAFKNSEDNKGFILRVYEPHGRSGRVKVTLPSKLKELRETNLLEEEKKKVSFKGNTFAFAVEPFKIKTFLCKFL